mgnify:CR=1 FL=1
MKVFYDPEVDVLRILFSSHPIEESDEDKPGVIIDYDKQGNIVGMESFEQRLILVGGMDFHRKILKGNAERGFRVCPWIPCLL